ncbi:MAG: 50S ribosomal protein L22 [Candidatus Moranbacteria bacterium RBG_19FT_COMBO_42_6]|nr:MAG: 50S ribosomal protein L22 [Candidatus Moranbacteria bacterium RBG_19FT_COMBO_42_6]
MQVSAKLNNLRIAPRKIRLVTNLIKKMDVEGAINQLDVAIKKGSAPIKKLLLSAISNGESNFGIDRSNMYVLDVVVGAGPTLKRWMPKAYGRAGQILKRTSRIELILEERVEGKDRKTKEQLEKERKKRAEEKKKAEKARAKEREEEEKSTEKTSSEGKTKQAEKIKDAEKPKQTTDKKGSWGSKIFRRKSM